MLLKAVLTISFFYSFTLLIICCEEAEFNGENVKHNFSSMAEAVANVEQYILKIKDASNTPSLAFGLAHKGKPIWTKAWGYSDLENKVFATVNTGYRLASVSKSFTSAMIGTLVDRGLLHYDDLLENVLNESVFPKKIWNGHSVNVTILHLLTHTSGIVVDTNTTVILAANVTEGIQKDKHTPLLFKPGTRFYYSNYGYLLLGAIIETITKKSYDRVMDDFFAQNNLHSTLVETPNSMFKDRARYYRSPDSRYYSSKSSLENVPTTLEDEIEISTGSWSDGSLVSNVIDLLHYGSLLIDSYKGRQHAMLSKTTLAEIWSSHTTGLVDEDGLKVEYGFGWFIGSTQLEMPFPLNHRHFLWHSGGLSGVTTWLAVWPEEEIVGVALSNKGNTKNLGQAVLYAMENLYPMIKSKL